MAGTAETFALRGGFAGMAGVRARVASHLTACGANVPLDDAELLLGEVLANAVTYGRCPDATIHVQLEDDSLLICVQDTNAHPPVLGIASWDDEGGRGLLLVEALAQDWGWVPLVVGKQVWFRLPVSGPRP